MWNCEKICFEGSDICGFVRVKLVNCITFLIGIWICGQGKFIVEKSSEN